jgi:hypothetical protein
MGNMELEDEKVRLHSVTRESPGSSSLELGRDVIEYCMVGSVVEVQKEKASSS